MDDQLRRDGGFTSAAARLSTGAALGVLALSLAYVVPLVLGIRSLPSQQDAIPDPYFAIMELLILLSAPLLVVMMAAVHVYASRDARVYSLIALIFTGLLVGVTSSVHIVMLTVGRQVTPADLPWLPVFLSFHWPSVIYALDILAWDLFYALAMLFAAPVFRSGGLERAVRWCMAVSGVLSLAGLIAPIVGDMNIRYIGIVGYAGGLPVVALLLALVFRRAGIHVAPSQDGAATISVRARLSHASTPDAPGAQGRVTVAPPLAR